MAGLAQFFSEAHTARERVKTLGTVCRHLPYGSVSFQECDSLFRLLDFSNEDETREATLFLSKTTKDMSGYLWVDVLSLVETLEYEYVVWFLIGGCSYQSLGTELSKAYVKRKLSFGAEPKVDTLFVPEGDGFSLKRAV